MSKKKILITGAAGFIGYHLTRQFLSSGKENDIIGMDSMSDYYDVSLKVARLADTGIDSKNLKKGNRIKSTLFENYTFIKVNLEDQKRMKAIFLEYQFDIVYHLGAQAGVRYSLKNPHSYVSSNVEGFMNILENCRHQKIKHLIYASSSSVYGLNTKMPFSCKDSVDHPISIYAATKKANELMAHTYSYLYGLPTTGLRFFTVYGPWGRPDMAPFLFTKAILEGKSINVFNHGKMKRDFTYIDDITENLFLLKDRLPKKSEKNLKNSHSNENSVPYVIYNIGNNTPILLLDFIECLEKCLEKKAIKNFLPIEPGDVVETWAEIDDLIALTGHRPKISIENGVGKFVEWYLNFYH